MSEWQPIKTCPNDTDCLIAGKAYGTYPFVTAARVNWHDWKNGEPSFEGVEFGGYEWDWTFSDNEVTHWMPLPDGPK